MSIGKNHDVIVIRDRRRNKNIELVEKKISEKKKKQNRI